MARRSAEEAPEASTGGDVSGAGRMMRVEDEVVRDLRHSVGNYFHKLYYWADRIGSEDGASEHVELGEELSGALQRFQEFLELGLRYFEADEASPMNMGVADVASASESVLRTELPSVAVTVEVADAASTAQMHLDPQRFSLALRLIAKLLGGTKREALACRISTGDDDRVHVTIEASGGEAPLETPVIEWAIARKAIAMQGGALEASSSQEDVIGGCVVTLPLGK